MEKHNKNTRTGKITGIRIERISLPGGRTQPKLILKVCTKKNQEFEISEAIIEKDGNEVCQGLWVNLDKDGNIAKKSTLNQLLKYFEVPQLDDLIAREVTIKPNSEQYFAISCI
jgi:hypothetical protein